jgi:hypothetical protein
MNIIMDIKEVAEKMTKDEFLKFSEGTCIRRYGIKISNEDCKDVKCEDCRKEQVKGIKFKDEEVVGGEKVEEVIKVRCKRNGFDFEKDKTYKAERTITGAYKLMNDKGVYHIFFGNDFSSYFEKVTDDFLMVECIDNKDKESGLTIGKKYEVKQETPMEYWVINDNGEKWDYLKTRFKSVESQKEEKKEYSFREVIQNIKANEKYECEGFNIICLEDGTIQIEGESGHKIGFYANDLFTKVEEPKPVTTSEAFKALEEGKTIKSYKGYQYKKEKGKIKCKNDEILLYKYIDFEELENNWIILE